MASAEFSEKAYEVAYDVELASGQGGHPLVYAPSQVLEKLTGFDAAANPYPSHVLWRILQTPRPPGVHLSPNLWASSSRWRPTHLGGFPKFPVSIFLQFKRPEFLHAPQSKQWRLWRRPYFRFERTTHQQQVLARLERQLAGQAVVRYAAPAFWQTNDLEMAQLTHQVVARSGHVAPSRLVRHRVWTYVRPGVAGRGNPDGEQVNFSSWNDLFQVRGPENLPVPRASNGSPLQPLRDHLARLGDAARAREPVLRRALDRWERALRESDVDLDLEDAGFRSLLNYAAVSSLVTRDKLSWWLRDGAEVEPARG